MNEEQQLAFDLITERRLSVCLTGQAGTGKSYVLTKLKEYCLKNNLNIALTAPTGIAACLIGGCTIHRWAGIGKGDKSCNELIRKINNNSMTKNRWLLTNILVIDEISMLGSTLFTKLEYIARIIRKKNHRPFGGIQLVACGDFLQLPPVKDELTFKSEKWIECFDKTIMLKQHMRQNDIAFQKGLSEIRLGTPSDETIKLFQSRVRQPIVNKLGIKPTKLYSRRNDVDQFNMIELQKLNSPLEVFDMSYTYCDINENVINLNKSDQIKYKTLTENSCIAPERLSICVGAQVMLIKNLSDHYVNGSRGVVVSFITDETGKYPVVQFLNCNKFMLTKETWDATIDNIIVQRHQIPLQLAFATTIHKSQGSTLDCVAVDAGPTIFDYGQTYVVLSRVKTLDGLNIMNFDPKKIKAHPDALHFYKVYVS